MGGIRHITIASVVLIAATSAMAQAPTIEQANAALTAALAGKPGPHPKVAKVLGCIPAFRQPAGTWVCPLAPEGDANPQPVTFVVKGGAWRALPVSTEPACPALKEAESLLRSLRSDPSLRVTGSTDDGEGAFTDQRGMTRDKHGAYRIMCRYNVATNAGKRLYIAYAWHVDGRYVIDPDVEIWDD